MKKLIPYILIIFSFSIYTAKAADRPKNKSIVFVEQGIEFIVYKNGSFDYMPLHRNTGASVHINTRNGSHININTANRNRVLTERDRAGRISRINNVFIAYHRNNKVAQIGNAIIDYRGPNVYVNYLGHYNKYPGHRTHYSYYR